jgi:Histidine kinase
MTMPETLLREVNHRVKNNFQIIVSLMNLKMRMLPPDRREDIRFLQEHVQSMAVAVRLVYATDEMGEVSVGELLGEVVSELRQIARLAADQIRLTGADLCETLGLDDAIAFGLYLAVLLPPYMDQARASGLPMTVSATVEGGLLTLSIAGGCGQPIALDVLRTRLGDAYVRQLHGEALPPTEQSDARFRLPIARPRRSPDRAMLPGA